MKKFLENLIADRQRRATNLREKIKASGDANEVRALGAELETVQAEERAAQAQLDALNAGGNGTPDGGDGRGANPMHEFRRVGQYQTGGQPAANADPYDTVEYRTAFMNFVCRGVPIPAELRATTTTTDAAAVIPTTILHEFVKEVKEYGNIFAKVRKLNVQGGVQIPILSLKPTAKWITANTGTEETQAQKLEAKTSISFSYYTVEVKLSRTLLTSIVTLDMFQAEFPKLAAEAIVHASEVAIVKGSGTGEPLGVINDTRVTKVVEMTAEEFGSWEAWHKKVFAVMPKAYRTGSFTMAQGSFEGYINGMVDKNGQPIGRVNYGIAGGESYMFGGKTVDTVEDDILPDFDTAAAGDAVAIFNKWTDYGFNTNMQMQVNEWTDHDAHEIKNNCIMTADGKLIDANGTIIIKKKAS